MSIYAESQNTQKISKRSAYEKAWCPLGREQHPTERNDTALQNIALKASRLPMEARKGHMTLLSLSRCVSMTAHSSGKYRILVLGGNTNENEKVSQAVRFAHVAIPEF